MRKIQVGHSGEKPLESEARLLLKQQRRCQSLNKGKLKWYVGPTVDAEGLF